MPVGKLHKEAVTKVRAAYQSKAVDVILPVLTENEIAVMKRGGTEIERLEELRNRREECIEDV